MSSLNKKYQKQFDYNTRKEAKKDLNFQKKFNPSTYRWLLKKDIRIAGKQTPVKSLIKKPVIKRNNLRNKGIYDYSFLYPKYPFPKYPF